MAASLSCAGVRVVDADAAPPVAPRLFLFDEVGPPAFRRLRELSGDKGARVLAVASGPGSLTGADAWRLLAAGASDVLAWDGSEDWARQVTARLERWAAVDEILESALVQENLVGRSRGWRALLRQVIEIARFTDSPVLLLGESGTGKELVARLIRTLDPRPAKKDLVVLDCSTIVPELAGSEFFGHERGAFTGAVAARDGAFALADGGTLFLDEVGELPLTLQAQLLRVVQEQTYKRVGGNTWYRTSFRLVCATNRDLAEQVRAGRFRHDLYHRIAGWVFRLPPLRERPDDILRLARHFAANVGAAKEPPELSEPVRDYLLGREYPGNVRELRQVVSRLVHRHVGPGPLTVGALPEGERPCGEVEALDWTGRPFETAIQQAVSLGVSLKEIGRAAEDVAERIALAEEEGNLQRAAARLGVTDRALQLRRAARRDRRQGGNGDTTP